MKVQVHELGEQNKDEHLEREKDKSGHEMGRYTRVNTGIGRLVSHRGLEECE